VQPDTSGTVRWIQLKAAALLLLAAMAVITWFFLTRSGTDQHETGEEEPLSIAVLPFDDLSPESGQRHFVEGITQDLITDLSHQPGLQVISPNTVFAYRNTLIDERAIAEQLGVRFLVRGAVQRSDDQLRINVRLLEAATGVTLWAERFSGAANTIFTIQDELVAGVTQGLRRELTSEPLPLERSGATQSLEAYDEYLLGVEYYGRIAPSDNVVAMEHFRRAIELDRNFARAHAGLALAWSRRAIDITHAFGISTQGPNAAGPPAGCYRQGWLAGLSRPNTGPIQQSSVIRRY
jgi:adenylate cyclase